MNFNKLRKIILKEMSLLDAEQSEPIVDFPSWLEKKIATIHGEPGSGSVFADPGSVKSKALDVISRNLDNIPQIANSTATIQETVPGIGYDLVLPYEEAAALPDAVEVTAEKLEGPNKIIVPAFKTSAPITDFLTDEFTVIVVPKKDSSGNVLPNEYIIPTVWPGKSTPRASEWNGKYAVIIPDQQVKNESRDSQSKVIFERWQKLAGILKG
jgi:hypothetical protein